MSRRSALVRAAIKCSAPDVVTDGRGGLGELRRVQRFAGEEGGTLEHDGAEVENDPLRPGEVASERLVAVATARLGIPRTSRW